MYHVSCITGHPVIISASIPVLGSKRDQGRRKPGLSSHASWHPRFPPICDFGGNRTVDTASGTCEVYSDICFLKKPPVAAPVIVGIISVDAFALQSRRCFLIWRGMRIVHLLFSPSPSFFALTSRHWVFAISGAPRALYNDQPLVQVAIRLRFFYQHCCDFAWVVAIMWAHKAFSLWKVILALGYATRSGSLGILGSQFSILFSAERVGWVGDSCNLTRTVCC